MRQLDLLVFVDLMECFRDSCHKNSVDYGFWDEGEVKVQGFTSLGGAEITYKTKPWNFGEKIALIHSELSEMFEAWRKGVGDSPCDKDIKIIDLNYKPLPGQVQDGSRRITNIEEEVADVLIRVLDLCGKLDIDVGTVVLAKMDYNKSRPMMHGGRKC